MSVPLRTSFPPRCPGVSNVLTTMRRSTFNIVSVPVGQALDHGRRPMSANNPNWPENCDNYAWTGESAAAARE